MLHLKVKHKLLVIWLGSIFLALAVSMALFQYQVGRLHEREAHVAIAESFTILKSELDTLVARTRSSAQALTGNDAIIASMSMISRYQDPQNYQPDIFDAEKRRLAQDLEQHALATGMDVLMLVDADGLLTAFYNGPGADGANAGYVVFDAGAPSVVGLGDPTKPSSGLPDWAGELWRDDPGAPAIWRSNTEVLELLVTEERHYVLIDHDAVVRTRANGARETVGHLVTARHLDEAFADALERQTGLNFGFATPQTDALSALPGLRMARLFDQTVPTLSFDGKAPADHAAVDTETHFIGAAKVPARGGPFVAFLLSSRADALQSTLAAFQTVMLAVLALSAIIIVPVGIYFLNRTITRPVEQLMESAAAIREGGEQAIAIPKGDDEFSELGRTFQDMSAAVQAREADLRNSQTSLKKAQRIAKIGNWDLDFATDRIVFSEMAHDILGTVPGDVEGYLSLFLEHIHPDDRPLVMRRIERTRDTGEPLHQECRIVRFAGEERFVLLQGELNARAQKHPKLVATIQDITERHMLEKAKSELISTVSHELRTPLTSIAGTLGLAAGGVLGELPDKLKTMLDTANINAKRLGALIDDLLDVEKIASGTMAMHMRPLSVPELLEQAREANQAYACGFDAMIVVDAPVPDVRIFGDDKRMAQVMSNLLSNAAKFTPKGGEIHVRATHADGHVSLSVSDQGPGIPEDFAPHLFERFAQADQSLTRADQRGGTGLGLSITKSIVELHDGTIAFTTTRAPAPGHGTTFTVTLPEWREPAET